MELYYLMAQLPSLDGMSENAVPPMREEELDALCRQLLGKKAIKSLSQLTVAPARDVKPTGDPFIDGWNGAERQLRLALAEARALRMHKPFEADGALSPEARQAAMTAAAMEDPLSAERFLSKYRLSVVEGMRPANPFSHHALLYYGLKLKLLWRMRQFDEEKGQAAYRRIYDATIQQERNGQNHES